MITEDANINDVSRIRVAAEDRFHTDSVMAAIRTLLSCSSTQIIK